MKQIYPDLWQTNLEKRFGTLNAHAYFLQREEGNALFYTVSDASEIEDIAKRGGVSYQYMSHSHEVDGSLSTVREQLGPKLCCHENVAPYLAGRIAADVLFSTPDREFHAGNIEVIHTPGHTNNNVCYRYASPHGKTYLFVGDVIYLDNGAWNTLIMPRDGGDRQDMTDSLRLLRTLDVDVDVIICSVSVGDHRTVEVTGSEWRGIIDSVLEPLTAK